MQHRRSGAVLGQFGAVPAHVHVAGGTGRRLQSFDRSLQAINHDTPSRPDSRDDQGHYKCCAAAGTADLRMIDAGAGSGSQRTAGNLRVLEHQSGPGHAPGQLLDLGVGLVGDDEFCLACHALKAAPETAPLAGRFDADHLSRTAAASAGRRPRDGRIGKKSGLVRHGGPFVCVMQAEARTVSQPPAPTWIACRRWATV
jgi:hypothetical protein